MDEKQPDSRPSNQTEQERNGTTSANRTPTAPTPRDTPDGGWAFVTQAHYDPEESRDLTTVIIGAIADAEDVPIVEVRDPPLYEVVDIAGVDDALFGRPDRKENGTTSSVEFRYNQHKVSVKSDGWVTVTDRTDETTTN